MAGDSLFALIIMLAAWAGAGLFIAQPLLQKGSVGRREDYYKETPLHELLSQKDHLYQGIKDLEFDYRSAKLSKEDYEALRAKLEKQAVEVLEKIDRLQGKGKKGSLKSISKSTKKKRASKGRFCSQCGANNKPGTKFCTNCGHKLATK